jgi:DNA repair protein RadC
MSLSQWPRSERPRERLLKSGPASLSDGELLAVLLGTGVRGENAAELARRLLEDWGGLAALLGASADELARARGLGPARAARLAAALELGRRYLEAPQDPRSALQAPVDAARFFKARLLDLPHEVFCCLFLDTRHRLIRYEELFRGTIDGATVYPREVVKRALARNAGAVILAHNHPSGVAEPSRADEYLTQTLKSALALVDVRVIDHLVVGHGQVVSFAERGLL